ncbi:MAG: tetratricopeptide repeat protein [Nitrospirae bacterium YQR-1]
MRAWQLFLSGLLVLILSASFANSETLQDVVNNANNYYSAGDYVKAISEFKKAVDMLKRGNNMAEAQRNQSNIGFIYLKIEDYENSLRELETALSLHPNPQPQLKVKIIRAIATSHYKAGNYALRIKSLEELLSAMPELDASTKADVLSELADAYRRSEIYTKAIKRYQDALPLTTNDNQKQSLILTAAGLSNAKVGNFKEAKDQIEKSLTISKKLNKPQSLAENYSNLGIIYWDEGQYKKALELISKAIEIELKNNLKNSLSADYNNEGLVYKSAGNYSKALNSFQESIKIAQQIKDLESEAIAWSNFALVKRIDGKYAEAREGYQKALAIYQQVKFTEGEAGCYLGLGRLEESENLNYQKAYEYYQKALTIYRKLGNTVYMAEALNMIGTVLRRGIDPGRTSRDLIFEEQQPTYIKVSTAEATDAALKAYNEALSLVRPIGANEFIWSALCGIGYVLNMQGKKEEAFKNYEEAIAIVMKIQGGDSTLLGSYMKDKADLFNEAIEIAAALYEKTKKQEYLQRQLEYAEIYKNEVMKNAMNSANIHYEDPNKSKLHEDMNKTIAQRDKLDNRQRQLDDAKKQETKSPQEKAEKDQNIENEKKQVAQQKQAADVKFTQQLNEWKSKYKDDAVLFDTAAKLDLNEIQAALDPDEALIEYFPLNDSLNIVCVTKEKISSVSSKIGTKELTDKIQTEITKKIYLFSGKKYIVNIKDYNEFNKTLSFLYDILVKPVELDIASKKKLIIVPNKILSYVPFSALVSGFDKNGEPVSLIKNKSVSYIRLSFLSKAKESRKSAPILASFLKILAIGNPHNTELDLMLASLGGAEKEVDFLVKNGKELHLNPTTFLKDDATKQAWIQSVSKERYDIFYFATHGVPYAKVVSLNYIYEKNKDPMFKNLYTFFNKELTSKSPLNGFLLMSYDAKKKAGGNGLLTLQEILALPESVFSNAKIAVLSACHTAVTVPPGTNEEMIQSFMNSKEVGRELEKAGWSPGVDQISLVDTFMRRNFKYTLGTFWAAEDKPTQYIMNEFFQNLTKETPAEAYRLAQLKYLEDTKTPKLEKHPYYWAVGAVFGR